MKGVNLEAAHHPKRAAEIITSHSGALEEAADTSEEITITIITIKGSTRRTNHTGGPSKTDLSRMTTDRPRDPITFMTIDLPHLISSMVVQDLSTTMITLNTTTQEHLHHTGSLRALDVDEVVHSDLIRGAVEGFL